jgi:hypothetical protein
MSTSTKGGLGSLPVSYFSQSTEEQTKIEELQRIQKELTDALQNRRQMFDPVLLAMAQGFLAPTKTGSFGESISNVAAQVGPAQAAADKERLERLAMQRELASTDLALTQAAEMDKRILPKLGLGPTPAGAPAAPGAALTPTEPPSAAPKTEATPPSAQKSGMHALTDQDLVLMSRNPRYSQTAEFIRKLREDERQNLAFADGVLVNKSTGQEIADFRQERPDVFPTLAGPARMTARQFKEYEKTREEKGNEAAKEWLKTRGIESEASIEEQKAAAKTRAEATAKAETERTQEAIGLGDVTGRMAQYRLLSTIASGKDASQIFGIVNRPDVGSAILRLVNDGVRTNATTIQAGSLIDAMRNVGLDQSTINKYELALSTMANIQLQQAKLAQGQGSVSNFERELFALASISPMDNPATIQRKVQMLQARAEFDRDVARRLRKSKMSIDEFKDAEGGEYEKMVDNYLNRIQQIANSLNIQPSSSSTRTSKTSPAATSASQDIRNRLGIK